MERKKVTLPDLMRKKEQGIPLTMLTAYDYPFAQAVDNAGIDLILVGDSYGMVVLGYNSTVPVTMEQMLTASQAVARGARYSFLVGDMPFMSYQAETAEAVRNAGRFIKEANMDAVKLEGGSKVAQTVRAITNAGIPVMGHIGLTPQSISQLGGYRTQGVTAAAARELVDDALALQAAGCFAIVLEKVPERVAAYITKRLHIPTIGIGAGAHTDGQVLVIHDLLGLFDRFLPKFAKQYAQLHGNIAQALSAYRTDVETRAFPAPEHSFAIKESEWETFMQSADDVATDVPPVFVDDSVDATRVY
ncbi:MAG: 3-methyl-2-oxobutanoate hydroxymethyltransferase [Chloroflexi bacterium]|nr:MAG: 3-methyl-2-oxobutanoate hydroxymethyltransferase [Chloroflexota bacterium]